MTDNERNEINHMTAMAGECPASIGGLTARHLTLETISVLDMCGSPIAAPIRASLNGQAVEGTTPFRVHDIAVLAWAGAGVLLRAEGAKALCVSFFHHFLLTWAGDCVEQGHGVSKGYRFTCLISFPITGNG